MKLFKKNYHAFSILPLIIVTSLILIFFIILTLLKKTPDSQQLSPPLISNSILNIQKSPSSVYAYENTTNTFQTYFKDYYFKESSITFKKDNSEISFYTPQNQTFGNLNSSTATPKNNTVIYKNVFTDTNLKYTLSEKRLLEEFIISTQPTALKFTQISQIANTKNIDKYEKNLDGSISFFYQNNLKFTLPKPVLYEIENQDNKNYGIEYQINKLSESSYEIKKLITPDGLEWLANLNRNYPIAIDLVIDNADTLSNWTSSDTTNLVTTQETTIVHEGTGAIKAVATNLINYGDGADGALAPSGAFNLNSSTSGSRSYADGIAYRVTPPNDSASSVTRYAGTDTLSNGIAIGDEVLLINLQGGTTDYTDVGNYEILEVSSVSASQIDFTTSTTKSYNGTTASDQLVVIQRVPNYTDVTLNSTDTLTASPWDRLVTTPAGTAGYYTGLVAFRASGTLAISATAYINVKGLGYTGGAVTGTGGYGGESFCTFHAGGRGGTYGAGTGTPGTDGICGGGGGSTDGNSTVGIGSSTGGAGGGGANAGGDPAVSGSGAGGGYGTAASGAQSGGHSGGTDYSGDGGTQGSQNYGGGGGGGGTYGSDTLSTLFYGSGGGAGGNGGGGGGGAGGKGGGIVFVFGNTINIGGSGIIANGNNGANGQGSSGSYASGAGGGGAGGSIRILGVQVSLGTGIVKASGGARGTTPGYAASDGGDGRIRIESPNTISGSSTPTSSNNTDPWSQNDTISTTKSALDLSSSAIYINFWVRSHHTGTNLQFQMGETLDSEQTFPVTINSADTWEQKILDLSSIPASSRDTITKYAFKIINNDVSQEFYFDDINAETNSLTHPFGCIIERTMTNSLLNIRWNDNNTTEDGYEIQKKTDGGSYSVLTTLSAGTTGHSDSSVSSGHTYQYKIIPYITGPVYGEACETSTLNLQTGGVKYGGVNMQGVKIN
jgi:hypothetical protein